MLKNILSTYFIKFLFSYIEESQKLKLIKYNKSLQKNFNISIINYKYFSKKYNMNQKELEKNMNTTMTTFIYLKANI